MDWRGVDKGTRRQGDKGTREVATPPLLSGGEGGGDGEDFSMKNKK